MIDEHNVLNDWSSDEMEIFLLGGGRDAVLQLYNWVLRKLLMQNTVAQLRSTLWSELTWYVYLSRLRGHMCDNAPCPRYDASWPNHQGVPTWRLTVLHWHTQAMLILTAEMHVTMNRDIDQLGTACIIRLYQNHGHWWVEVTRACDISTDNPTWWSTSDKITDHHKLVVIITTHNST